MFGYYAICAKNGKNFMFGMDIDRVHWSAFYDFCEAAEKSLNNYSQQKKFDLKL
jgi:hypothetical protein